MTSCDNLSYSVSYTLSHTDETDKTPNRNLDYPQMTKNWSFGGIVVYRVVLTAVVTDVLLLAILHRMERYLPSKLLSIRGQVHVYQCTICIIASCGIV